MGRRKILIRFICFVRRAPKLAVIYGRCSRENGIRLHLRSGGEGALHQLAKRTRSKYDHKYWKRVVGETKCFLLLLPWPLFQRRYLLCSSEILKFGLLFAHFAVGFCTNRSVVVVALTLIISAVQFFAFESLSADADGLTR